MEKARKFDAYTISLDGKVKYVGITTQGVEVRWSFHKRAIGGSSALVSAMRKYGADAFVVSHVASARTAVDLNELECVLVEQHRTFGRGGYNLTKGGKQNFIISEETKRRMSAAGKGHQRHTPESKAKIGAKNRGKVRSEALRELMSKARLGTKLSAAHKAKIAAKLVGRPKTAREMAILAEYNRTRGPPSEETREKMSAASKARRASPATKLKMSIAAREARYRYLTRKSETQLRLL